MLIENHYMVSTFIRAGNTVESKTAKGPILSPFANVYWMEWGMDINRKMNKVFFSV